MQTIRRDLSRYRNELKGIAILWIVLFHIDVELPGFLYQIQRIGYGGVDLFFFLSGFGLYYSLEKNADLKQYMIRRGERLLPAYLPFCLVWLAVMLPAFGMGLANSARIAASNLSMLGFLTGNPLCINWYTGALLMSLALAPFFHALLKPGRRYWLRAFGLLVVLTAAGIGYIDDAAYKFICRLPVMVIGMIAAGCMIDRRTLRWLLPVSVIGAVAALMVLYRCLNQYQELLVTYAMYWHPFVLIAPVACVGICWGFSHLPASALKPLKWLGEASFEIFLFNAWAEVLCSDFAMADTLAEWGIWSFGSIAAGMGYHFLVQRVWKDQKTSKKRLTIG